MGTLRLFVAVGLPDDALDAVAAAIGSVRDRIPQARWVPRTAWHVTLAFLGPTPGDLLGAVTSALSMTAGDTAAARANGMQARLAGLGAFPSAARARVIWVGLDDPGGRLATLAGALGHALAAIGMPQESRPWRPHLTVARLRVPEAVGPALAAAAPIDTAAFRVSEIVLFQSHLRPHGASYEALARFPLAL